MITSSLLLATSLLSQTEPLVSPTYDLAADQETIARHAVGCVTQHASSGRTDIPTIQTADPTVGTVVAINFLRAEGSGLFGRDMRTSLRIDARDGRFRVVNTDFELFSEWRLEWSPIGREDRQWPGLEARLNLQSVQIAACIRDAAGDW